MSDHKKEQGLSLLDIGPIYEDVDFGEKKLRVYGISAAGILSVFQRFPEVMSWFKGGDKVNLQSLVTEIPDALAACIAAGCGSPGNIEAEDMADRLPVETQLDIIEAIGRLTFKSGFGPFVQRMLALVGEAQSVSFGRAQVMKSPQESPPASLPDLPPSPPGT
jgi:hypothetical protein